jgi:hypothetical protein
MTAAGERPHAAKQVRNIREMNVDKRPSMENHYDPKTEGFVLTPRIRIIRSIDGGVCWQAKGIS